MNRACSMYEGNEKFLQSVIRKILYVVISHEIITAHKEIQEYICNPTRYTMFYDEVYS